MQEWLAANLTAQLTLEDVAGHAHMSPRTLERRFRAETGDTVGGWIARRRVERARVLLEETDLSILQVAHDSGFGSAESLRRHFVSRVGTSPRAYREVLRGRRAPAAGATPVRT